MYHIPSMITHCVKFLQIEPVIIFIHNIIPDFLNKFKKSIVLFKPFNNLSTVFISQRIRLLYPCLFDMNEIIMIQDIDMFILNKNYINEYIKDINNGFKCPFLGYYEIDMKMCCAKSKIWKDIFKINNIVDIKNRLIEWSNNDTNSSYTDKTIKYSDEYVTKWHFDQRILRTMVFRWLKKNKNNYILHEDKKYSDGCKIDYSNNQYKYLKKNRLNRCAWLSNGAKLNSDEIDKLKNNKYIDFNSPFFYKNNKEYIDQVLKITSNYYNKFNV